MSAPGRLLIRVAGLTAVWLALGLAVLVAGYYHSPALLTAVWLALGLAVLVAGYYHSPALLAAGAAMLAAPFALLAAGWLIVRGEDGA